MAFPILRHKRKILTIIFVLGFVLFNYAQPGGPGGAPGGGAIVVGGAGGGAGGATGAPIDGGVSYLFILGLFIVLERKFNLINKLSRNMHS